MSVWLAIPSARPLVEANVCLVKWRKCGYKVAVQRDGPVPVTITPCPQQVEADCLRAAPYEGYANSVNALASFVLRTYADCRIIVTGGDDIDPDPRHDPDVLEREFLNHFKGSFGVMQPTGDRWMVDEWGRSSEERVCSSPWLGREFCERMYGGQGPLWPGWFHFYEDEELHEVAQALGVLQHRSDICQYHHHWMRTGGKRPQHLSDARLDWSTARTLFEKRKAAGFPGHEPLSALMVLQT